MIDLFRNTLPGWQWALLALVPPAIIALYFLKLKRQPLEVPSTYLWRRSIEDLHVNSLWQRLRQNLLLFLQLLLVALAMLALLRPGWEGTRLDGERFIFLVDHSASMSATDVKDAKNRLDEAKRLVGALIDQMESGMTAMIISFADSPQVVQEFTDNRRLLRERLATIEPTVRGTDLRGALDLADGLANPSRVTIQEGGAEVDIVAPQEATVYIFSDGRFEDVKGFSLGNLKPVYVPVGSLDARNLAITAFTTRRSDIRPEERQAFAQVANFTEEPRAVIVEVQLDGEFLDAKQVDVPAGETSGILFPLADAPAGALTATLKYELDGESTRDALRQDDLGYAALNNATPGKVLVVTPGNVGLEVALGTERAGRLADIEFQQPEFMKSDDYKRATDMGTYQLILYDQCAPTKMPRANTLFIGRLPPGPVWLGGEETSRDGEAPSALAEENAAKTVVVGPQIIDWNRAHPLMANVEFGNVDIADSLVLDPPAGGTVLIDSTAGPLAAVAPRDAFQDVVIGFEIFGHDETGVRTVNTNWPRRLSFPTFWLNMLEFLGGGTEDSRLTAAQPGQPVELRVPGNIGELTVKDPTGREHNIRKSAGDVFQFHDTGQPGVYEVRRGDQITERFAVNLFDREESNVRLIPSQDSEGQTVRPADIQIGHVDVTASVGREPARKEAWKFILIAALFVLVFEWYIYNRRVYL
ncbi:MAG: BatA and WFA domain-containing protein [Planctomycetes bacterium]|nr:BatA and WFA domain-containing protein [Planctomycetota bacterium]